MKISYYNPIGLISFDLVSKILEFVFVQQMYNKAIEFDFGRSEFKVFGRRFAFETVFARDR